MKRKSHSEECKRLNSQSEYNKSLDAYLMKLYAQRKQIRNDLAKIDGEIEITKSIYKDGIDKYFEALEIKEAATFKRLSAAGEKKKGKKKDHLKWWHEL